MFQKKKQVKVKKRPVLSDSDNEQDIASSNDKQVINYGKWVFQERQFVVEFAVNCKQKQKQLYIHDYILIVHLMLIKKHKTA